MLERLFNIIRDILRKMVAYKSVTDAIEDYDIDSVSDEMRDALKLWKDMYKDDPSWIDSKEGVYSFGTPKSACQIMTMIMLDELNVQVVPPNYDIEKGDEVKKDTIAGYLQADLDDHLLNELDDMIEKALALGGCIIKPYISGKQIYYDFIPQGDFYPISFDDDGNITDIAFYDQFTHGDYLYTRIERQTFADRTVVVENKAFKTKLENVDQDEKVTDLGLEIPLTEVEKWKEITPKFEVENVERPLYGYYKVAIANNVDLKTPLGISFFHPAAYICRKIDEQFSRLDWEYEGGQLAIDVDPTAIQMTEKSEGSGYFNTNNELKDLISGDIANARERVFRRVDLGQDDTYKPYNPTLRDESYLAGLNRYLTIAEDKMGLSRGSLAIVEVPAKTATELRILEQRAHRTARNNQTNLEKCLKDVIEAAGVLVKLYSEELGAPKSKKGGDKGKFETIIDFGDSILVDRDSEIAVKVQLCDKNIISKAEVRSYYTGESLKVAKDQIEAIREENQQAMLPDIFSGLPEATIEKQDDNKNADKKDKEADDKAEKAPKPNEDE